MNKPEKMEKLKREYENIEISSKLDSYIQEGILKGRKEMENKKISQTKRNLLALCASITIVFGGLTVGVNLSPTFAQGFENIPVLGKVVEVLRFVDGRASGGEITDGTDISEIGVISNEESETLIIRFNQGDEAQSLAGAYTITYSENPYVMTFEVAGARMISALEDIQSIKGSKFVDDVYTLITLDDSMIRFNVVFNTPVIYEVTELKNPASLVVTLSEDYSSHSFRGYSVRTLSYEKGEGFGILEESIMFFEETKGYRVLKDSEGLFYIEFAQVATEEEGMRLREELEELTGLTVEIEKLN